MKFYLGPIGGLQPGRQSTSDSSEKLFQRDRGKRQYICDFGKGGVHAINHILFVENFWSHEASASHEKQSAPWRIVVLFEIWGDTRIGLIKSAPENIWLSEDLSCQFPQSTECLISALFPEFFQGVVGGQQLQQHMICFDPCTDRWQVLMTSANLWSTVAWIKIALKSWLIPLLLIPPQKEQPVQNHFIRCAADSFRGSSDLPKDAFLYPLGQQHPEKCLLSLCVTTYLFILAVLGLCRCMSFFPL